MRNDTASQEGELLGESALSAEELARACGVAVTWVHTHVQEGVLGGQGGRFGSATLVRARRIVHLEHCFDADPQLAALAADLMEEVADLRQRLRALGAA